MEKQLEHNQISNSAPKHQVVVLAEGLHSPENVGSIFRICDAMGVQKLYFSRYCPETTNRKVKKTARDTIKSVEHEYIDSIDDLIQSYRSKGYKCQALEITSNSISLHEYKFEEDQKYFVIIGSERNGVDAQSIQLMDECIHIPMYGKNSSMNVAVSLGIYLSMIASSIK